jgi:hypothetical protein
LWFLLAKARFFDGLRTSSVPEFRVRGVRALSGVQARTRSHIRYEQMLGRATRLCPEIGKETFRISAQCRACRVSQGCGLVSADRPPVTARKSWTLQREFSVFSNRGICLWSCGRALRSRDQLHRSDYPSGFSPRALDRLAVGGGRSAPPGAIACQGSSMEVVRMDFANQQSAQSPPKCRSGPATL